MKKIIKIREGELIPTNARFIESKIERGKYLGTYEKTLNYGIIFDTVATISQYEQYRVYIYEVEEE